nr:complement C5 isoform X7 [Rattus norvegicus]
MVLVPFQALGFWGTLLFLIFLEPSWEQEQTRYIISTPIVFRVGAPENVTVQAYGYTEAFDTTISVKSYPNKNVNYSSGTVELSPENKFQNSAILTDPEGSEVGIIGGRNGTGIASFPDFKIPSNPKESFQNGCHAHNRSATEDGKARYSDAQVAPRKPASLCRSMFLVTDVVQSSG